MFYEKVKESAQFIESRTALRPTIGMSTVPETIAANYLGMKVLGIACITNMATGLAKTKHSHEEVMRIANESSEKLCSWVRELLMDWQTAEK